MSKTCTLFAYSAHFEQMILEIVEDQNPKLTLLDCDMSSHRRLKQYLCEHYFKSEIRDFSKYMLTTRRKRLQSQFPLQQLCEDLPSQIWQNAQFAIIARPQVIGGLIALGQRKNPLPHLQYNTTVPGSYAHMYWSTRGCKLTCIDAP